MRGGDSKGELDCSRRDGLVHDSSSRLESSSGGSGDLLEESSGIIGDERQFVQCSSLRPTDSLVTAPHSVCELIDYTFRAFKALHCRLEEFLDLADTRR